jgi:hypothetical protein
MPVALVALATLSPIVAWAILRRSPIRGRSLPGRWLKWMVPACFALACALCAARVPGALDPLDVGIRYGADKFKSIEVGGASSLAGILKVRYGYESATPVESLARFGVTISHVLIAIHALAVVAGAWAMRRFERGGDVRFLLAMAAPWIVYFAVFPKMHERYLLWGAVCGCCCVAVGLGPALLAVFFSLCSLTMSLFQMIPRHRPNLFLVEIGPNAGRILHDAIVPTYPGLGWAILLATAVWIWLTVAGACTARKDARGGRAGGMHHPVEP